MKRRLLPLAFAVLSPALALCPATGARAAPAPFIIVMMENHGYSQVIGNPSMPYFNSLWSEGIQGTGHVTDFTQMYAVTHPSLPNYLAITSGSTQDKSGSNYVSAGQIHSKSVWDQLTAAGISWGVFEEGMPSVCYAQPKYSSLSTDGLYMLGHNPGTPYNPVYTSAECNNDKPLNDLSTSRIPQVTFVTPNICDDQHGLSAPDPYANCVAGTSALASRGDSWLKNHVSAWTAAGANVLITYDEGSDNTNGGGHIAALLTGPAVKAGTNATLFTHYSVLAGIEKLHGLKLLGHAGAATPLPVP
jgi:phosphatidylinositol-3-phosphatase